MVEPDAVATVTFNQAMERSAVEEAVVLRKAAGEDVAVSFEWSEGGDRLSLRPLEPLDLSTSYEVLVPDGLAGARGLATIAGRHVVFRTVAYPQLLRTSPADGDSNVNPWYGIRLSYNNPMDRASFEDRVSISGIDPEDIWVDSYWYGGEYSSDVYVNAPFDYDSEYTVRIAEGVRDRGGRTLPASEFSFSTATGAPSEPLPGAGRSRAILDLLREPPAGGVPARRTHREGPLPPLPAHPPRNGHADRAELHRYVGVRRFGEPHPRDLLARGGAAARLDEADRRRVARRQPHLLHRPRRGRPAPRRRLPLRRLHVDLGRGGRGVHAGADAHPPESGLERGRHGDRHQVDVRRTARLGARLRDGRAPFERRAHHPGPAGDDGRERARALPARCRRGQLLLVPVRRRACTG